MSRPNMSTAIASDGRFTEGLESKSQINPALLVDDELTETALVNRTVAKWFDAGVRASGKAMAVAAEAGVSEQFLGQVRQGKKAVSPKLLVALFSDPAGFIGFATAVCEEHGLAPPKPRRKATKAEAKEAMVRHVKQLGLVYKAVCEVVAADLGTSTDDIEAALEADSV